MPVAAPAPDAAVFARHFSLEATRPSAAEVAALADIVPPATPIYFSAVPTITPQEIVAAAALQELLSSLRAEADVRRLLVIGGDVEAPGAFSDALAVIQKGRLREAGIEEIGIGAYPEGHSRIPASRLESALDEKIAAATAQGLRIHIVSQFSFSPERILAWLKKLRACGIGKPVKIGMAGPTSVTALLRYARRCGVAASLRGLASGVVSGLVGNVGPDLIIETLSAAGGLGDVAPHYFSFGGTLETARYACEAAAGRHAAGRAMARTN